MITAAALPAVVPNSMASSGNNASVPRRLAELANEAMDRSATARSAEGLRMGSPQYPRKPGTLRGLVHAS